MDIGIPIPNLKLPGGTEAIERIARRADELGFHSVWIGDHVVRPLHGEGSERLRKIAASELYRCDLFDPLATAGFVAAVTNKVRIGFGVLVIPYRNPIVTAKAIATIDQLSHGRVILGVGPGYWTEEFRALGIPQRNTGAITDEAIDAFRTLWASDTPSFHGEHIKIDDVIFKPRPVQQHLPIWIGGASDAALRRTARRGDGWHWTDDYNGMRPLIQQLKRICDEEGRHFNELTISARPAARFAKEPQYDQFGAGQLNPALVGPPEHIVSELLKFKELGIHHVVLDLHEREPLERVLEAIEITASEVAPHLK